MAARLSEYGEMRLVLAEGETPQDLVGRKDLVFRLTFERSREKRFSLWGDWLFGADGLIFAAWDPLDHEIIDPLRETGGLPYPLKEALSILAHTHKCEVIVEEDGQWLSADGFQHAVKITLCGIGPIRRATKLLEAIGRKLNKSVNDTIWEMRNWSYECV